MVRRPTAASSELSAEWARDASESASAQPRARAQVPSPAGRRPTDPHRRRDRQRQPGREHGQPLLLVPDEFGGRGAPRQPDGQLAAEPADEVVPPVGHHLDGQMGQVGLLGGQEPPHQLRGDVDLGGRPRWGGTQRP